MFLCAADRQVSAESPCASLKWLVLFLLQKKDCYIRVIMRSIGFMLLSSHSLHFPLYASEALERN